MGNVVDLFSGQEVPAADDSEFVTEFIEGPLGDFMFSLQSLKDAKDEAAFRECLWDLKRQANEWSI